MLPRSTSYEGWGIIMPGLGGVDAAGKCIMQGMRFSLYPVWVEWIPPGRAACEG